VDKDSLNLPKDTVILFHKDFSCALLTDCITHRLLIVLRVSFVVEDGFGYL